MATIEQAVAGGVSFALTEEQKALRDLAHDFAEKEIRPKEREYDEHSTHPANVIARAHEVGLMNVHVPEAFGGLEDRKSTRLNSSHPSISYAVFCLKKKKRKRTRM